MLGPVVSIAGLFAWVTLGDGGLEFGVKGSGFRLQGEVWHQCSSIVLLHSEFVDVLYRRFVGLGLGVCRGGGGVGFAISCLPVET